MTEGTEKDRGELRERNVNPGQLLVNLWPLLKRTLSSQPQTGARGGAAKFSRPLTGGCGGEPSQGRSVPPAFF